MIGRKWSIARRFRSGVIVAVAVVTIASVSEVALTAESAWAARIFPTMNDSGGVYWRSAPNWNTAVAQSGNGFYSGTSVSVSCYQTGTTVPGSANTMWVKAAWASGPGHGSGWMNEHFVNDGAAINHAAAGIPACGTAPPPPPPPPPASGPHIVANHSASLDWCPGNAAVCQDNRRLAVLGPNMAVHMGCWLDARHVNGYTYNRWFYVSGGGHQGFVKAELVTAQAKVPNCSTNLRVSVSLWATWTSSYGQTKPTAEDVSLWAGFGNPKSTWGAKLDWSGDCVAFVYLAWHNRGAGRTLQYRGNARPLYDQYVARGPHPTKTGTPPRGALVFWNAVSGGTNFGHVAISLGNGRVVGTQGWDNQLLPTTDRAIWSTSYLGWVLPY